MFKTKAGKDTLIIHLFALLHAGVALSSRLIGIADDLMLTLLTMLLTVIICLRRGMDIRFMALSVIAVNIFGFALGKGIARMVSFISAEPLLIYPLSTFVTTEVLGWGLYCCTIWRRRRNSFKEADTTSLRWLLIAFVVIICTRLAIVLLYTDAVDKNNIAINVVVDYAFSCIVLVFLAEYALRISARAQQDQEKARLAQYSYLKLKQQVNPHFLFNSLNVLDCLVNEQKTEQSSTYIHKLAGIYRYMIGSEDRTLVPLRDEMEFVGQYVDLMLVRFPKGLEVEIDIPESILSRNVVPCAVQMLVENATKHNVVSESKPLHIHIGIDEFDRLVVINNIRPKRTSRPDSTGLGLKYIQEQYLDLSGRGIEITTLEGLPSLCECSTAGAGFKGSSAETTVRADEAGAAGSSVYSGAAEGELFYVVKLPLI